jgi:uncharacterized protein (TIGR02996 family)
MDSPLKPSRFAAALAAVLDDNVNASVSAALAFEQALLDNPADAATRAAYRDWLLENDCPTRAAQLADGLLDQAPGEYRGLVRPEQAEYQLDWAEF